MLKINNLKKSFNFNPILLNLNFELKEGEIVQISGSNGSGKTTLLKIIAGLLSAEFGDITIFNKDLLARECQSKQHIIYWGHQPMLYPHLTTNENINFFLKIRNQSPPKDIDLILDELNMLELKHTQCNNFSQGMFQRFNLLRLIVSDWNVGLLDEPFSGLDTLGEELLFKKINQWKNHNRSLIIVSHNNHRLEKLSNYNYEIKNKRLVKI
tara:strand:- start:16 stop:648 length:633 start_codon:yes stop_codon:yes gene_type:complete